jgi:hypothetical protein
MLKLIYTNAIQASIKDSTKETEITINSDQLLKLPRFIVEKIKEKRNARRKY